MATHPNRSRKNPSRARNPRPAEIRAARESVGLTQTEAAEVIDCHLNTWQQWESEDPTASRRMHPTFWRAWRHLAGLEPLPFGTIRKKE